MHDKKKCYQCKKYKSLDSFMPRVGNYSKKETQIRCKKCVINNRTKHHINWDTVLTLKENAKNIVNGDKENVLSIHEELFLEQQSMIKDMDDYIHRKLKK